ncbi:MAG: c-type cytochrome [Planctomycetota bacterium]
MPRWIYTAIILVNLVMLIPPVLIFKARSSKKRAPRIHLFHDMDHQKRYEPQAGSDLFADGRAMRLPVAGTVARGELNADDHYHRGVVNGEWAQDFPPAFRVNAATLARGQDRFGVYCSPCHGLSGHGDGMVRQRSEAIGQTWLVLDVSAERARTYPIGQLYNIITNGISTMPSYRATIPVEDRWAIVAYVKALQFSQAAPVSSLPPDVQLRLSEERGGN